MQFHVEMVIIANFFHVLIQKVLSEGVQLTHSTLTTCFLVDEKREDPTTTKSGPLSAHHRNAIVMVFYWWADNGPILNAGLVTLDFPGDP